MKILKFTFEIYWPLPNVVKKRPPYTVHTALHVKSMLKIHSASSFTNVRVNEGSCIYVGKPLLYCCNKKMYCDGISNKKSCILFCVPEQSWLKSSFALCSFNYKQKSGMILTSTEPVIFRALFSIKKNICDVVSLL